MTTSSKDVEELRESVDNSSNHNSELSNSTTFTDLSSSWVSSYTAHKVKSQLLVLATSEKDVMDPVERWLKDCADSEPQNLGQSCPDTTIHELDSTRTEKLPLENDEITQTDDDLPDTIPTQTETFNCSRVV